MKIIIWHLSHALAVAASLASETEHRQPYVGATCLTHEEDIHCAKQLWDARCYEPVAIYDAAAQGLPFPHTDAALEFVFEKTNHIHDAWNKKGATVGLKPLHHEGNRSTSVGDVAVVITASNRRVHLCSRLGWQEVCWLC